MIRASGLRFGFLLLTSVHSSPSTEPTLGDRAFVEKPYVQLGDAPRLRSSEHLRLLWHANDEHRAWKVDYRLPEDKEWKSADVDLLRKVAAGDIPAHRVYGADLKGLAPGREYQYRVKLAEKEVFQSSVRARKDAGSPYRFVVFGDCSAGTEGQKAVAYQTFQAKPDFVAITGDIVYSRGLISEYRAKYFPVYNADTASPETGAPLIRSTLFVSSPGNHDVGGADLTTYPDGLAYYLYWAQPLNGPSLKVGDSGATPLLGATPRQKPFLASAGKQFPRMASFSFDYGNSHWTVLDSNKYADWYSPALRDWLKRDLAAARDAKWRFVIFHHPGFNSSIAHFKDQWMRLLAPAFEEGKVDIVFAGHVHNYQRSHPLRYAPHAGPWRPEVDGVLEVDRKFDGTSNTSPGGVLYLITGAGGAKLYNPEQNGDASSWQEFTSRFVSDVHSFTVADVEGGKLTVRQVDSGGKDVDRFVVTK